MTNRVNLELFGGPQDGGCVKADPDDLRLGERVELSLRSAGRIHCYTSRQPFTGDETSLEMDHSGALKAASK
jgi:hypothetical protein